MATELGSARVLGSTIRSNSGLLLSRLDDGVWEISFDGATYGVYELQVHVTPDSGEDPPGDPVTAGFRVVAHNNDPDDARVRVHTWKNGALEDVGFTVMVARQT